MWVVLCLCAGAASGPTLSGMANTEAHEAEAIESVCARLAQRYPEVDADTVERTVRQIHERLDGPVRDYVPVLVEHMARDELSRMSEVRETSGPSLN